MNMIPVRITGDVSDLPVSASGHQNLVWWGNVGFMLIEGTAFLLAGACYFYLVGRNGAWPPFGGAQPDLLWGGIFTAALVLSQLPNFWLHRVARKKLSNKLRFVSLGMCAIGVGLVIVRGIELGHLNVRWDDDAYGSVVWMLMVLHTSHVLTELGEMIVQTVWLFTHEIGDDQFSDLQDGSNYWTFVVLAWLPIYVIIYWVPRWV